MAAHYYYKPLPKNTIKIEDITPNVQNQAILHKLKQNDPSFNILVISDGSYEGDWRDGTTYIPGEREDISWLGCFLGKNSYVKELEVKTPIYDTFYKGLSCNKSIRKIHLNVDLSDGQIFYVLDPFKQKHSNLNEISINNCIFGTEGALQLSIALGGFNNESLKQIILSYNQIGGGQMNNVITALGVHTNLETLRLPGMNIGRTECVALSTMIRWGTTKLQQLDLQDNNIDDESVKSLVHAIGGSKWVRLSLARNQLITSEGYKTLSTLLERPDSSLEKLLLYDNNIDSTTLAILANSLANNSTLKTLDLAGNTITDDGWLLFSKLLHDVSSVNKTYVSNHTLKSIGKGVHPAHHICSSLALNGRSIDKGQVAMKKILQHHSRINVYPFFEWEWKVLPLLVTWFAKAAACAVDYEERIKVMKFNAIYDFVRELPMLVGCSNMGRNEKRRSVRRLGSRMSTGSMFDNPEYSTVCNCSCVIS